MAARSDKSFNDHDNDGPQDAVKRRPMPRRGHRKSRAGCATCKGRKVKCDEVAPECGQCRRLTLRCRYRDRGPASPAPASVSASVSVSVSVSPSAVPGGAPAVRPLRMAPGIFSSDDLRFFQHFLFTAYPSLPIGGGCELWQHVAQMSHDYEFLIHAILGLGASHLDLLSDVTNFSRQALSHRVLAIQALNEHLARIDLSPDDADAALAALLSLTFQSAYMPDGMTDFLCLIRGCFIIGTNVIPDMEASAFKAFARAPYVAKVHELARNDGPATRLNEIIAKGFRSSLGRLAPLCTSVPELEYMAMMQRIAAAAVADPVQGYHEQTFIYDKLAELSPSDFKSMLDPANHVSRLIIMHMLAIDFVMSRKEMVHYYDGGIAGRDGRGGTALPWLDGMWRELPDEYRVYGEWPRNLARALTFSFGTRGATWRPFLLHEGKARVSDMAFWESHSTEVEGLGC